MSPTHGSGAKPSAKPRKSSKRRNKSSEHFASFLSKEVLRANLLRDDLELLPLLEAADQVAHLAAVACHVFLRASSTNWATVASCIDRDPNAWDCKRCVLHLVATFPWSLQPTCLDVGKSLRQRGTT